MFRKPVIIFWGSSEFTLPILQKLMTNFKIKSIVTKKPKLAGRNKTLVYTHVDMFAQKNNISVLYPNMLTIDENLLNELACDFFIVASYGSIIQQKILDIPRFCALNIHPSLLPKYRGASPIPAAILSGDKQVGVSIIKMNDQLDAGEIFSQSEPIKILPSDNQISLLEKCFRLAVPLVEKVILDILTTHIIPVAQDHSKATYTKLLHKQDGLINWQFESETIALQIKAYYKWPGSYSFLYNKMVKVLDAEFLYRNNIFQHDTEVGTVSSQHEKIFVKCGTGILEIKQLQLEGRAAVSAVDFINGYGAAHKKLKFSSNVH